MPLHTINKSPDRIDVMERMANAISAGDEVILIENGVYWAVSPESRNQLEESLPQNTRIYAIKNDGDARGMADQYEGITLISYEEFVKLTEIHRPVVSWY